MTQRSPGTQNAKGACGFPMPRIPLLTKAKVVASRLCRIDAGLPQISIALG